MYRKSLSNLLGGSLLVASLAALNACGGETGTGGDMPSAGTPGTPTNTGAGTPASGSAGKPAGSAGSAAAAGAKAAAGSSSMMSGVSAAGKSGAAGTTAAAAGTAAAGTSAAAGSGTGAAGTAAAAGTGAAAGSGAGGGAAPGGALGGKLEYTGAFTMGMSIAAKHKCPNMGDNVSPALEWKGGPADTKSFAIVLFDTTYMMLHWAIWDIPASVNKLPEGLASGYELAMPMGAHQAANMGMDDHAYYGPCSGGIIPVGTYEYRLYALKVDSLGLMESTTATQAQTAIEGMMLEKAVWAGMPVSM